MNVGFPATGWTGLAGLAVLYAMSIARLLSFMSLGYSTLDDKARAVAKLQQLVADLPREESNFYRHSLTEPQWLTAGAITFDKLTVVEKTLTGRFMGEFSTEMVSMAYFKLHSFTCMDGREVTWSQMAMACVNWLPFCASCYRGLSKYLSQSKVQRR